MAHVNGFWKLEHLSDAQLLESLGGVLRSQRGALAEIVAHLGEVEERRPHLEAAYSSMFAYCVARLGMSEDEACRRIELARLARKFPPLFAELANGRITLSVALLLRPVLTPGNHLELLAAARGKCMRQARELLAERFPKPDVPSSIRKLPERRLLANANPTRIGLPEPIGLPTPVDSPAPLFAAHTEQAPSTPPLSSPATISLADRRPCCSSRASSPASEQPPLPARPAAPRASSVSPLSRGSIQPLSAGRYRVQFTADLELKQKLELACDLLRHTHPSGDLAGIVSRALELLLADAQRRQFGAKPDRTRRHPASAGTLYAAAPAPTSEALAPSPSAPAKAMPASASATDHAPSATPAARVPMPGKKSRPHIARATRRAVLERDGLGCSWVDGNGVRCGSRAWLQLDHREPIGKGGGAEPENLRLLCRAHNRLAAERAYGREHIDRMSRPRRQTEHSLDPSA